MNTADLVAQLRAKADEMVTSRDQTPQDRTTNTIKRARFDGRAYAFREAADLLAAALTAPHEITVWSVVTCYPSDHDPIEPNVFGSEAEARDGWLDDLRIEWDSMQPADDTGEPIPFPEGNPEEAHRILALDDTWGQYKLTSHKITIAE